MSWLDKAKPATSHICPAGCGRSLQLGKFLCAPCWAKVPKGLQREVYSTWDAYRDAVNLPTGHPQRPVQVRERREDYQAARKTALEAIA